ncbi:MAG: hypothetical protein JXQ29_16990 [Planctomycetes bacterium]|nr:hypothetical protein [Planctomycetota bacterium]
MPIPRRCLVLLLAIVCGIAGAQPADDTRPYAEGRHGPATLRYEAHIPVLKLYGTPAEMGEQAGRLIGESGARGVRDYLARALVGPLRRLVLAKARQMEPHIPADYRAEMAAFAAASPLGEEELLLVNTFADVKKLVRCTTIAVSRARSVEGTPLLGRNFDFPTLGVAERYALVVVYHPRGKKSFASITHPGFIGTHSFLNEDGLAGAVMEVPGGDPAFSPAAMPALMLYRRIAESAAEVAEALAILEHGPRCTSNNLMLAAASGDAALAEFSVRRMAVRRPENGLLFGTNHHRAPEMCAGPDDAPSWCPRMRYLLEAAGRAETPWSVESVKTHLARTAQGSLNIYSMVLLPEHRAVHLAAGSLPAARGPFVLLDRACLFGPALGRRRL